MNRPRRKSTISSAGYEESPEFNSKTKKTPRKSNVRKSVSRKVELSDSEDDSVVVVSDEEQENPRKTTRNSRKSKSAIEADEISPKKQPKLSARNRTPSLKALESITTESSPSIEKLDSPGVRKSSRNRTPNKKLANDYIVTEEVKKSRSKETAEESEELEEEEFPKNHSKPTDLFEEGYDVAGKEIFGFKTPAKKGSMLEKAVNTPKSARIVESPTKTPRSSRKSIGRVTRTPKSPRNLMESIGKQDWGQKTPKVQRERLRKNIKKLEYASDEDFSVSGSDYDPSENSSSSSEAENSQKSEDEEETPPKKQPVASRILKTPSSKPQNVPETGPTTRRSLRIKNDTQIVLKSDDYFSSQSAKNKTSNHTLDRLKTPRLNHERLQDLLCKMELSSGHQKSIKVLNEEHKFYFDRWMILFEEGYSILLHGLGSKRNLLQDFHKKKLSDQHVIVVNGFYPDLTIKDVLGGITDGILEIQGHNSNLHEIVDLIEKEMLKYPELHIFLLVHNLDGVMLRNEKAQNVMSRLASLRNVHLIASIDHINAPMLWDHTKLSNYNFSWWDATTMLPYTEETCFENCLMVENSGSLELSSMKHVYLSLNSNAKGIYNLIVKHQLKNGGNASYPGMAFKELYSACREAFFTSSVIALRAQLTEFLDHKLARNKRDASGAEYIVIPIKNNLLEKFLNENQ